MVGISKRLKKNILRSLKIQQRQSLQGLALAWWCERALRTGQHDKLKLLATRLGRLIPLIYFFYAHSLCLQGQLPAAKNALSNYLNKKPNDPDARYLAADILRLLGNEEESWNHLVHASQNSRRLKTWLHMANLVVDAASYQRFTQSFLQCMQAGLNPADQKTMLGYQVLAAARAGLYAEAVRVQMQRNNLIIKNQPPKNQPTGYTSHLANEALIAVNQALQEAGIEVFLISGTLLGFVREGKLLGHDKDVDVGVWDDVPRQVLLNAIFTAGCFYIQPQRSLHCLRLKHINGVSVDVFTHYRDEQSYWHAGVKVRWHNSPFQLNRVSFLGKQFLVPTNVDRYLSENYGDWRIPKIQFDSAVDTTNAEVVSAEEMLLHCLSALVNAKNPLPYCLLIKKYSGALA